MIIKESGVLAGVEMARRIFKHFDLPERVPQPYRGSGHARRDERRQLGAHDPRCHIPCSGAVNALRTLRDVLWLRRRHLGDGARCGQAAFGQGQAIRYRHDAAHRLGTQPAHRPRRFVRDAIRRKFSR